LFDILGGKKWYQVCLLRLNFGKDLCDYIDLGIRNLTAHCGIPLFSFECGFKTIKKKKISKSIGSPVILVIRYLSISCSAMLITGTARGPLVLLPTHLVLLPVFGCACSVQLFPCFEFVHAVWHIFLYMLSGEQRQRGFSLNAAARNLG